MAIIFAAKSLVGNLYLDAKHGHILRTEKQIKDKTLMSVYCPYYGWQTFSVPETYLLKEIPKNQLIKIEESVMKKMEKEVTAGNQKQVKGSAPKQPKEKGESINSVIDEMMLKGSTIGEITKKIISKFSKLEENVKTKGEIYASRYVYSRIWSLKNAKHSVTKQGHGVEAKIHLTLKVSK
jgi:hypothetical protein